MQALKEQKQKATTGQNGTVVTAHKPTNADITYSFMVARVQFLNTFVSEMWNPSETDRGKAEKTTDGSGFWGMFKALTGKQRADFLVKQFSQLLYRLSSTLFLLATMLLMIVIAFFLYLIAGLAKFAAIFVMAIFLFLLPFAYFWKGLDAIKTAIGYVLSFLFLKGVVFMIIWTGFYLIEAVVMQGYLELGADSQALTGLVERFKPGWMYTDAGSDILFLAEQPMQLLKGVSTKGKVLVSLLVVVLTMAYMLIKAPGYITQLFQFPQGNEDLATTSLFIAGTAVTGGKLLAVQAASKKTLNQIDRINDRDPKPDIKDQSN